MIERIAVFHDDGTTSVPTYRFGERVKIDDGNVIGRIIGMALYPHDVQFQVSWWNNGALSNEWIAQWRLSKATP